MDEEMDHGPILFQKIQTITPADTFLTLSSKLNQISAPLLLETIANYEAGKIQPKEQDHKEATYSKIFSKQDGRIDWRKPAQEIYNQYRALVPWPGVWTTWNGSMMKITDCGISTEKCTETPGTILPGGGVACGDKTVLSIKALQLQGKNPTDVESFLRGHRDFVGSTLE
jgi:methionyl-tRNA formyltransferase